MYNHVQIVINDENKTLTLALPNNLPEGDVIGPYSAMYYHINEDYTWVNYANWCGTDEIDITLLRERTTKAFWEYYHNDSIIVDEDFVIFEHLGEIVEELGYLPSYLLQIQTDEVNLVDIENKDYAYGAGEYYYDGNNLKKEGISYNGIPYNGEYLRCIFDINDIKSGQANIKNQEIFIPFKK